MPRVNGLNQLSIQIADLFNKEELTSLCYELGIDYDDLPAEGKSAKALELVDYMRRRGRLPELLTLCEKRRPLADWTLFNEPAPEEGVSLPGYKPLEAVEPPAEGEGGGIAAATDSFWREPYGEPDWVEIPAGEFWLGLEDGRDNEKPIHKLFLDTFFISRIPVTNAQYHLFVAASGYPAPEHWPAHEILSEINDHPVRFVSFYDALAYCQWLSEVTNKEISLPSEAQWEKAARGYQTRQLYPWGDTPDTTRANTEEAGLNSTTPVNQFPSGASPYGVLDMCGNVWEWTLSAYKPYPYNASDGRESLDESDRVLRGGAFYSSQALARCSYRSWDYPDARQRDDGFRVIIRR